MKIDALERELPPVLLLIGPDLDGMEAAAREAVHRHGAVAADTIVVRVLTALGARTLISYASVVPFGPFKAFILRMDEASEQAQNIMLKALEEPPPFARFILLASRSRPLPTIMSRCQVIIVPAAEQHAEPSGKVAAQVRAALKAAAAADLAGLDASLAGWGAEHQAVLEAMLTEAAVGPDVRERGQARRLLGAFGRFAGASPRLTAHAALVTTFDRGHHD